MNFDFDVIIVGTGVAGALCAYKLAQHGDGARILMIDPGVNDIDDKQRMAFRTTFALTANRNAGQIPTYMDLARDRFAPSVDGIDLTRYLVQSPPPTPNPENRSLYKVPYQRLTGGSTWTWRGNCPRFIPSDFELKTRYAIADDWPFKYDALEPWYCDAEDELGISGSDAEWGNDSSWVKSGIGGTRSRPFPMPNIVQSFGDRKIIAAIGTSMKQEGVTIEAISTPQARISDNTKYPDRSTCRGNSNCIPLCPTGAKYDAGVHLRKAFDKGVQIRKGSVVTRLEAAASGNVHTVVFRDWRQDISKDQRLTAKIVVLAANAVETPKIWLTSELGNKSDQVGRNLMDHLQIEVVALFPEPIYTFRGPQGLSGIEVFRDGPWRNTTGAFRMTIGNDGWGRAELPTVSIDKTFFPADKPPIGKAAKERLRDRVTRMMRISCSTEQLPSSDNRITLSEKRDELGLPRPQTTYRIDDYSKRTLERAHKVASAILSETVTNAGGDPAKAEIQPPTPKPPAEFNTAAHAMGTMKMTSDPSKGVVNSFGRAHEHPNLYVLGSSVFVTASSANPTLTIAALTLRTAAEIGKRL
jgi:glucose dehydrogenase